MYTSGSKNRRGAYDLPQRGVKYRVCNKNWAAVLFFTYFLMFYLVV